MPVSRPCIDWKSIEGTFHKARKLHFQHDKDDLFHCPAPNCEIDRFVSQRGCQKHVKTKHPWYIYFDDKPKILNNERIKRDGSYAGKPLFSLGSKTTIPCCDVNSKIGRSFSAWLQSTTGGGKQPKQAEISVTRAFKFLKYCCEQSGEEEQALLLTIELVDYFLCSSKFLTDFLDYLESTWQMGQPGRLGYVTGIADLLDFRQFHSSSGPVLQNFCH